MDVIPADVAAAIKAGKVNLDDPAVTLTLLQLNAVVGVKGTFDDKKISKQSGLHAHHAIQQLITHLHPALGIV